MRPGTARAKRMVDLLRTDGVHVVRAATLLVGTRIALRGGGYPSLARHNVPREPRRVGREVSVTRIVRWVNLGSRATRVSNCLARALVAERLLRAHGFDPVVRYGVGNGPSPFPAHAWVECDGQVVLGGDVSGYVALNR